MKLNDLKVGDIIQMDGGFTCMPAGPQTVCADADGGLYVKCEEGAHTLDGQEDEDGELVGCSWPSAAA